MASDIFGHNCIQISAVPEGQEPALIRKAWLGLSLPALPETIPDNLSKGGQGGRMYAVLQSKALEVLGRSSPVAAAWWKDHGYPKTNEGENCFYFPCNGARAIGGVFRHPQIVHVTETA